jgi:hypothetical protein
MISLYNDILYGWTFLNFLFFLFLLHTSFEDSLFYFYWKLAMVFFWGQHSLLSLHFYLYSVKEENTLHFENFEKNFFVFYYCKNFVQFQMCVEVYRQW